MLTQLSPDECDTLLKLDEKGPAGSFDQMPLGRLFALGLIEVSATQRRLVLTEAGRSVRDELARERRID